jgi:transposase-like protein
MSKHHPVEQRERAVKMVLDHLDEYRSVYAACQTIGPKVGVGAESLGRWVLQAQVDGAQRPGATTAAQQRIKDLERENRDLKEANEILKAASIFFARELAAPPLICGFIDETRAAVSGSSRSAACSPSTVCRSPHARTAAGRLLPRRHGPLPTPGFTDALRATIGTPEGMYGRRKMTAYLRRQGYRVAACTVDRLMRDEGLSGLVRGRQHRTTIPGRKDSHRAPDLLDRDFTAAMPNRKWVTDFTYTRTWSGFVYVAVPILSPPDSFTGNTPGQSVAHYHPTSDLYQFPIVGGSSE